MSRGTAAREMSWALTLLLVFALLGQRGAGAQDVAEGQMIDRLVVDHVDRELLSGVILVAENGLITFQKAFGFANWELRVPNSPATRFGIGSITKTLTPARGRSARGRGPN